MAFDSAIISFTTKTDKVDLVQAAHMNAVQAELVTIETILGTNVKGDRADLKTRLNNALDADGSILSGTAFPSPALTSQMFFRTDLGFPYIFNGSWQLIGSSLSNVLFQYVGQLNNTAAGKGEYVGTSINGSAATGTYRYLMTSPASANDYTVLFTSKWIKLSGVSTITFYGNMWVNSGTGKARVKLDVGGQNATLDGTLGQTTPLWSAAGTLDVSSLSNGTAYDVTVSLTNTAENTPAYLGGFIAFGS